MEPLTLTQDELVAVFQLWYDETTKDPDGFSEEPLETYAQRSANYFRQLVEQMRVTAQ
jgi:hypothetical protein